MILRQVVSVQTMYPSKYSSYCYYVPVVLTATPSSFDAERWRISMMHDSWYETEGRAVRFAALWSDKMALDLRLDISDNDRVEAPVPPAVAEIQASSDHVPSAFSDPHADPH